MARSTDPSGWMWSQACDMIEQAERMHRQFFRAVTTQPAEVVWEPPADVFEDEREVVVVLAMPGVRPERMEVRSEGDTLLVRGVRPLPLAGSGLRVRHLEIPYGRFERRIALPSRGLQLQEPELVDGCVILRLRKNDGGAR
jgi:HSP20 family protein